MKFWQVTSTVSFCLLAGVAVFAPAMVTAAEDCTAEGEAELEELLKEEYVVGPSDPYYLEQPFGGKASVKDIGEYIQTVYQFALGLVAIIAVVLIMLGGTRWIMAAGNEQVIGEAKDMVTSAILGLVIALLSYTILLFINPRLIETDVQVFKIPLPLVCPFLPPDVVSVPTIAGLNGNGKSACPNAAAELQKVATFMRTAYCSSCTIGVSSGYRTPTSQQKLYNCYQRALAEGVEDGSSCPSGCPTCNLAAEPCCSNHEKGMAFDLWLEGLPSTLGATTSQGKLKGTYNNGGAGGSVVGDYAACGSTPDPELCKNQALLRTYITYSGFKFTGISAEWWHFDYTGECQSAGTSCTPVNGYADNAYCKASEKEYYTKANCNGGTSSCSPLSTYTWNTVSLTCSTGQHVDFTSGQALAPFSFTAYTTKPNCAP